MSQNWKQPDTPIDWELEGNPIQVKGFIAWEAHDSQGRAYELLCNEAGEVQKRLRMPKADWIE